VPKPVAEISDAEVGIFIYGSTSGPLQEARDLLKASGHKTDFMRLRALPFTSEVRNFTSSHKRTYVIDLNRDGQIFSLLLMEWPELHSQIRSLRHYEGTPITADWIAQQIHSGENL
jgi:2-oxoglutarate ferredoxin oxidoreductase subunit alpha